MAEKKQDEPGGLIARNRRARFNYTILEKLEAGISLLGTEVKSCRERNVDLAAAFARIDKGPCRCQELVIRIDVGTCTGEHLFVFSDGFTA